MKKLEEPQDKMPEPLPALHSVVNLTDKKSPIHLLARGEYNAKGDRVGMRPLGVLLPDGTPELPEAIEKPRTELAKWIVDSGKSADRAGDGESHLAISFRPGHRRHSE